MRWIEIMPTDVASYYSYVTNAEVMSLINFIINKLCHNFFYKHDSQVIFHLFLCYVHYVKCT